MCSAWQAFMDSSMDNSCPTGYRAKSVEKIARSHAARVGSSTMREWAAGPVDYTQRLPCAWAGFIRGEFPKLAAREYNGSMPTPTDGLSTALAQVMETRDDATPGSDPAEQLSLDDFLELPSLPDGKPATGHIGRPPGWSNRRTKEWVNFLETRYGNPLEVLMQIAFAKVDELTSRMYGHGSPTGKSGWPRPC